MEKSNPTSLLCSQTIYHHKQQKKEYFSKEMEQIIWDSEWRN